MNDVKPAWVIWLPQEPGSSAGNSAFNITQTYIEKFYRPTSCECVFWSVN